MATHQTYINEMASESSSPWWAFVKEHLDDVKHIKNRKEKFQALSELYKNEKAAMVTVHGKYLMELHETNAQLKQALEKANLENKDLRGQLAILKSHLA